MFGFIFPSFIQYYSIMEEAQINLDSHYRLGSINLNERFAAVEKYSALIHSWMIDWERELREHSFSCRPVNTIVYGRLRNTWALKNRREGHNHLARCG